MEFYEVLERRRTIRDFSDKIVTDEVLEKILSAAFKA
ncbi:nitroreductase family protein, partial [Alistipes finegoldii]